MEAVCFTPTDPRKGKCCLPITTAASAQSPTRLRIQDRGVCVVKAPRISARVVAWPRVIHQRSGIGITVTADSGQVHGWAHVVLVSVFPSMVLGNTETCSHKRVRHEDTPVYRYRLFSCVSSWRTRTSCKFFENKAAMYALKPPELRFGCLLGRKRICTEPPPRACVAFAARRCWRAACLPADRCCSQRWRFTPRFAPSAQTQCAGTAGAAPVAGAPA